MDIRIRLIPAAIFVGLIIAKVANPGFLATRIWEPIPITWYWIVLSLSLWIMAWALTPPVLHGLNWLGKRAILPATIFVLLIVGLLWGIDAVWNHGVRSVCESCSEWHLLTSFTTAMFGS